jgi:hypothetical protein
LIGRQKVPFCYRHCNFLNVVDRWGNDSEKLTGILKMKNQICSAHLRIQALQMTGSGCGCLDAAIRLANSQGNPLDLATLNLAREFEERSPGCRLTIIRLLDREIRRQENAQAIAA